MRLPAEVCAFANVRGRSGQLGRAFALIFQWKAARETEAAFLVFGLGVRPRKATGAVNAGPHG
jgi:hypothetical protein